ncbi:MAG TPA: hypothetical protein VFL88_03905 [Gemmatimonadales bacterium]|nr:hypothetical protein [Gemmatimonadales bacterium]
MTALLAACAAPDAPPHQAASVTREQFRQLAWITGSWRGSGTHQAAFFEDYRFVNDSTIQTRSLADSSLRNVTDSSTIEWRKGFIEGRSAHSSYVVTSFTPTSITFIRRGEARQGHTFARVSADEWTATLHPAEPGGEPVIYTMRRIGP